MDQAELEQPPKEKPTSGNGAAGMIVISREFQ
jgi:hypothetical protein